jgi:hypothetical protein
MTITILQRTAIALSVAVAVTSATVAAFMLQGAEPGLVAIVALLGGVFVGGALLATGFAYVEVRSQRMAASVGNRLRRSLADAPPPVAYAQERQGLAIVQANGASNDNHPRTVAA